MEKLLEKLTELKMKKIEEMKSKGAGLPVKEKNLYVGYFRALDYFRTLVFKEMDREVQEEMDEIQEELFKDEIKKDSKNAKTVQQTKTKAETKAKAKK